MKPPQKTYRRIFLRLLRFGLFRCRGRACDDVFAAGSIDALLATPRGTMTCASAADSAANMPWQVNHKLLSYSSAYLTHSLLDSNSNGYVNR